MSKSDDFMPTRRAAHEYSERSIDDSREFMSHPEAVEALGELAPRMVEVLDHLHVPETFTDDDGTIVVELDQAVGPQSVPVISAPAETAIRIVHRGSYVSDELLSKVADGSERPPVDALPGVLDDELFEKHEAYDDESSETKFRFSKFGGLAMFLMSYSKDFAALSSPIVTLNMHGPNETQADPYVLLHEALHAADVVSDPIIDLRQQGFYRHLLRYELRGFYVSAKILDLQERYGQLFKQYNVSYEGIHLVKAIEDARSRHNEFMGIDPFEPDVQIDADLRRQGIFILGSHVAPNDILGK